MTSTTNGWLAQAAAEITDPQVREAFSGELVSGLDGRNVRSLSRRDQRLASELVQCGYLLHDAVGNLRARS